MSQVGTIALSLLYRLLTDSGSGVNAVLSELAIGGRSARVCATGIGVDVAEKAGVGGYPSVHISCSRIVNSLHEKFREFSGTVQLEMDARVTDDDPEELAAKLHAYVCALTTVLQRSRGRWADGYLFTGRYEVHFGAIRRGGRNYLQTAKVQIELNVSE